MQINYQDQNGTNLEKKARQIEEFLNTKSPEEIEAILKLFDNCGHAPLEPVNGIRDMDQQEIAQVKEQVRRNTYILDAIAPVLCAYSMLRIISILFALFGDVEFSKMLNNMAEYGVVGGLPLTFALSYFDYRKKKENDEKVGKVRG